MFKIGEKVVYFDENKAPFPAFIYKIHNDCIVLILEAMGERITAKQDQIKKWDEVK